MERFASPLPNGIFTSLCYHQWVMAENSGRKIGLVPVWAVVAVCAWIAWDIGSGALHGIARAKQRQLDNTPVREIIADAALSWHEQVGEPWTEYATLRSVSGSYNTMIFRISLSSEARESIEPRWAKNRIVGMRHKIRGQVCSDDMLKYLISRGVTVKLRTADKPVKKVLPTKVSGTFCL